MTHNPQAFVRWGLAFVFIYAGLASLLRPLDWVGYFPPFLLQAIPSNILLPAFGVLEIALGVWLLWGKKTRVAGGVAFFSLLGITLANLNILDVVFRDVGLAFAALAVAIDTDNK